MRRRLFIVIVALALTLALVPATALADELGLSQVDTGAWPVVTLSVTLPSSAGDVAPTGVRVWENGTEISGAKIGAETAQHEPVDVVLVIDVSSSMKGAPLVDAQAAAAKFISSMGPQDRVAIVAFSSSSKVVSGLTGNRATLESGLAGLVASGPTALFDGISTGVDLLGKSSSRRAIVVLSDGGDTVSTTNLDTVIGVARGVQAQVYAVGLQSPDYDAKPLSAVASATGGRLVDTKESSYLQTIYGAIASELSKPYVVSYTSAKPGTPDLEIRLEVDGTKVPLTRTIWVSNPAFKDSAESATAVRPLTALEQVGYGAQRLGIGLVIAVAVGLLAFVGTLSLARRPRTVDELALYGRLQSEEEGSATEESGRDETTRSRVVGLIGAVASKRGFTGLVRRYLERAGLPLRTGEYVAIHFVGVVLLGFLSMFLSENVGLTILVIVLAAAVPIFVLEQMAAKRKEAFEAQLPDLLMLIAGSLRAGWGLPQSIDFVVKEASEPALTEFRRVQAETRIGLPMDQALGRVADRLGSDDFRWTASAIAIQREVGGNLSEVLETLAATIRERAELRRQVRSLTAEGRISAIVLEVLPFVMLGVLYILTPGYASLLVTTPVGQFMLLIGFVLLAIGVFWIQRVVRVDV